MVVSIQKATLRAKRPTSISRKTSRHVSTFLPPLALPMLLAACGGGNGGATPLPSSPRAPVVGNATGAVAEDSSISFVAGVVPVRHSNAGSTATVTSVNGQAISNVGDVPSSYGVLTINANGNWTYTLANRNSATNGLRDGQQVTDVFTIISQDAAGAIGTGTVTITISGANDKPLLENPESLNLKLFTSQPLNLIAPVDDDANPAITIEIVALPSAGVIQTADGRDILVNEQLSLADFSGLIYRSAGTKVGQAGFLQYRATDSTGNSSTEIINFNIVAEASDLLGAEGDDRFNVDTSKARYFGLAGADFFEFSGGSDVVISGGNGNDTLNVNTTSLAGRINFDLANSGPQNQDIPAISGIILDSIEILRVSSSNAVSFFGDDRANILTGGIGDDVIDGRGGKDEIVGGNGRDILSGGDGMDTIDGRDDNLFVDILSGGSGADTIYADSIDVVTYADAPSYIAYSARGTAADGGFSAEGEAASDTLYNVGNVIGSNFDDHLGGNAETNLFSGGDGDDWLEGLGNADTLLGGAGNDRLEGGEGGDLLVGGSGTDVLLGGNGADRFVALDQGIVTASGGTSPSGDLFILDSSKDIGAAGIAFNLRITDFLTGADRLDLSDMRDTDGTVLTLSDILSRSTSVNTSVEISLDNFLTATGATVTGTVVLENVAVGSLGASQFVFTAGIDWQALLPAGIDY